jgi:hypothetical protein
MGSNLDCSCLTGLIGGYSATEVGSAERGLAKEIGEDTRQLGKNSTDANPVSQRSDPNRATKRSKKL